VTLQGNAENEAEAHVILKFVERVPGVVSIEPKLTWPRMNASSHEETPA
jgi:hypothetical protein